MAMNYLYGGTVVDYTNTGTDEVKSGDVVVMGDTIGVAMISIHPEGNGSVKIQEAFRLPKDTTTQLAQGKKCYWKAADKKIVADAGAGTVYAGRVLEDATATDATVVVKLNA